MVIRITEVLFVIGLLALGYQIILNKRRKTNERRD